MVKIGCESACHLYTSNKSVTSKLLELETSKSLEFVDPQILQLSNSKRNSSKHINKSYEKNSRTPSKIPMNKSFKILSN